MNAVLFRASQAPARNRQPNSRPVQPVPPDSPQAITSRICSGDSAMPKDIRLNAFGMNCVAHQSSGLWRHPRDRSREYRSIRPWQSLALTLEQGLFDGIFLADVTGVYDVYQNRPDAALKTAMQIPTNDPFCTVPVMAAVTEHLGFGITGSIPYEPPYAFARRNTDKCSNLHGTILPGGR